MNYLARVLSVLFVSLPIDAEPSLESDRIEAILAETFPRPDAPGAAVIAMRDGEVVFIGGRGLAELSRPRPITENTQFRIASVSKSFTAMAVMILAEEGKLSFDDPVTKRVRDFADYGASITIRNLLNHTSGLEGYEGKVPHDYDGFVMDRDVLEILKGFTATKFPPGSKYEYSNSGYALLAVLVEEASGIRFDEFMRVRVFEPLGMSQTVVARTEFASLPDRAVGYRRTSDGYVWMDTTPTALVMGDGGIYSTIRDFALWEKGLRENALVSAETLGSAYTGAQLTGGELSKYGFGWEVSTEYGVLQVGHSGNSAGFAADFRRVPSKGLAVAVFMNQQSFTGAGKLAAKIMAVIAEE